MGVSGPSLLIFIESTNSIMIAGSWYTQLNININITNNRLFVFPECVEVT